MTIDVSSKMDILIFTGNNMKLTDLNLVLELARANFSSQFKDSLLGLTWLIFSPLLMIAAYTLAFGMVFNNRWDLSGHNSAIEFSMYLYSGLLFYNAFTETLIRSSTLIKDNSNYVKKIVFPLLFLNASLVLQVLIQLTVGAAVWVMGYCFFINSFPLSIAAFPCLLALYAIFLYGISIFTSAICHFVPDLKQAVNHICHFFLFLSPIFYSAGDVPNALGWVMNINPLVPFIESAKGILWGEGVIIHQWGIMSIIVFVVVGISYGLYSKLRPLYADYI